MIDFSSCIHLRKKGICRINKVFCNPDDESITCVYEKRMFDDEFGIETCDIGARDPFLIILEEGMRNKLKHRKYL